MSQEQSQSPKRNKTILIWSVAAIFIALAIFLGTKLLGENNADSEQADPQPAAAASSDTSGTATASATTKASETPPDVVAPKITEATKTASAKPTQTTSEKPVQTQADVPVEIANGEERHEVEIENPEKVVAQFAEVWSQPGVGKANWLMAMRPHITYELYQGFGVTDIEVVPADTFVNAIVEDEYERGYVKFNAKYKNGGRLMDGVAVLQNDGTWLVDKVVPGGDLDLD